MNIRYQCCLVIVGFFIGYAVVLMEGTYYPFYHEYSNSFWDYIMNLKEAPSNRVTVDSTNLEAEVVYNPLITQLYEIVAGSVNFHEVELAVLDLLTILEFTNVLEKLHEEQYINLILSSVDVGLFKDEIQSLHINKLTTEKIILQNITHLLS